MPPKPTLPTDWHQASRFYNLIHNGHPTEFRFINGTRVTGLWGDLTDAPNTDPNHKSLRQMTRLNSHGYGAYMVINTPNPQAGTAKFNTRNAKGTITDNEITHATALFVDLDRPEKRTNANLDALQEAEIPPSLIVQSSYPHKVHGYWLIADLGDINLWRRLQAQLIAKFSGDPACKNPSRIMRIPGFWHTKGEPIQSRLISDPGTTYTVAEITEIFELDPDLEVYSEAPTNTNNDDWVPPPGINERLMRAATKRAQAVTNTDTGRHNALLWFAMSCRENNLNPTEANTLMLRFANQLPARQAGPISHKEATDALEWAYAKKAGQNAPWRTQNPTITTTNNPNDNNPPDDLDTITSPSAKAPITIQAGGYASIRDTTKGPITTQLTNWTFTPTLTLTWPDGSTGHRGELTINTTHTHQIDLPSKAWTSRRDLLTHIGQYDAVIFANSNSDIAHIRQFILTNHPNLPTAQGVTTYGLHNINNTWAHLYQNTHHEKIFYVGTPVDPGPAYRNLKPGTPEQINQARQTIRQLLELITPAAAMALIGYGMASTFSPRITPLLGDRLPFLYITGERESGKSSSIELILTLTTGHPSARLRKAPGLTPYQYDSSFANLNNRLAALDEYRPGSIDDAQLRKHHDLGIKWRGSGIAAKDHAYILNAPLIVAGEGFTEDAAALSRGPLYFINKEDRGNTQTYLNTQTAPNWAYAHHLAQQAGQLPEPDHQTRFQHAHNLAKTAANNRGGPRLEFALTYIAYGLLHAQADVCADLFNDQNIQLTLEVGVTQTLEGGDESKTNLESFFEQLGSVAAETKDPSAYLIPGTVEGTVIVRISPAVELVKRRYGRDAAISNARLLRQYAQKPEWVDTAENHKAINNYLVRGIRVLLPLAPKRCDLSALEYLEQQLRHGTNSEHQTSLYGGRS